MNLISAPNMLNFLIIFFLDITFVIAQSELFDSMNIILYQGTTTKDVKTVYPLSEAADMVPHLNPNLKSVLYIHGFIENQTRESLRTTVNAFLANGGYNVLTVDYSRIAMMLYEAVIYQYFEPISEEIANALIKMNYAGLKVKDLYLVGYSLGAQVAGRCGDILRSNNLLLGRITGLDPAALYFSRSTFTLNKNCAKFVDIIHTDMCGVGTKDIVSHADFIVNCGKKFQPYCRKTIFLPMITTAICSHNMVWKYFAESITTRDKNFIGFNAISNKYEIMGLQCPSTARGTFYLTTNDAKPYAKGYKGLSTNYNCGKPCIPNLF